MFRGGKKTSCSIIMFCSYDTIFTLFIYSITYLFEYLFIYIIFISLFLSFVKFCFCVFVRSVLSIFTFLVVVIFYQTYTFSMTVMGLSKTASVILFFQDG